MRVALAACLLVLFSYPSRAQEKPRSTSGISPVTVPATIDHNRVLINVEVRQPDGSWQTIRAWVDNGNPDLYMSRRVATALGLNVTCGEKECSAPAPQELAIAGMAISLADVKEAKVPLRAVSAAAVLAVGMNAEINIPSRVLRHYDVLVDFPGRKVSIGLPGTIHFRGSSGKIQLNAENGLVQVPAQIEGKKYNLALDLGASINFLSEDLFSKIATAHSDWPHMTGAVGSANMWGANDEAQWNLMRLDRVQYGALFLTNVPFVKFPKAFGEFFGKRAGIATAGLLGSEALLNYRVGLDYAHATVYFDIGRTFNFPDFDVVGVVLRPEEDGQYTVLGVAEFEGKPSVEGVQPGDHLEAVNDIAVHGLTMGQVWSMLGGTSGQEKKLTMERGGKEFAVLAKIQHFLGEAPEEKGGKKLK